MFGPRYLFRDQDNYHSPGFEDLPLRASGQPDVKVKSTLEILELTLKAWQSLPRSVFAAAWISCGYVSAEDMAVFDPNGSEPLQKMTIEEANAFLSDMFSEYGKHWTPQRCTTYEWQVEDSNMKTYEDIDPF